MLQNVKALAMSEHNSGAEFEYFVHLCVLSMNIINIISIIVRAAQCYGQRACGGRVGRSAVLCNTESKGNVGSGGGGVG